MVFNFSLFSLMPSVVLRVLPWKRKLWQASSSLIMILFLMPVLITILPIPLHHRMSTLLLRKTTKINGLMQAKVTVDQTGTTKTIILTNTHNHRTKYHRTPHRHRRKRAINICLCLGIWMTMMLLSSTTLRWLQRLKRTPVNQMLVTLTPTTTQRSPITSVITLMAPDLMSRSKASSLQ